MKSQFRCHGRDKLYVSKCLWLKNIARGDERYRKKKKKNKKIKKTTNLKKKKYIYITIIIIIIIIKKDCKVKLLIGHFSLFLH